MPRKKEDPKLAKLREQIEAAGAAERRWYQRLKRALGRLDDARRAVTRLRARVEKLEHPEPPATGKEPS